MTLKFIRRRKAKQVDSDMFALLPTNIIVLHNPLAETQLECIKRAQALDIAQASLCLTHEFAPHGAPVAKTED